MAASDAPSVFNFDADRFGTSASATTFEAAAPAVVARSVIHQDARRLSKRAWPCERAVMCDGDAAVARERAHMLLRGGSVEVAFCDTARQD